MKANSRRLAALVGPAICVISVTEARNFAIWAVADPTLVFLNGAILMVGGLALIQAHNHWRRDWSLLLTLVAWAMFAGGLWRMIAPTAPQASASTATYVGLTALFLVGAVLAYQGLKPTSSPPRG